MDAHSRRQAALAAIDQILNGACPADVESDTLDFKEEAGTNRHGHRQAIPPRHEPAAKALAEEVACFANSSAGGVIVVGVDDKEVPLRGLGLGPNPRRWFHLGSPRLESPGDGV